MAIAALIVEGGRPAEASLEDAVRAIGSAGAVWIDSDARSPEVEKLLADLKIHPLTIEDVFEQRAAPKVEEFGAYLYVLAKAVAPEKESELDIIVGNGWVFTHHEPGLQAPAQVRAAVLRLSQSPGPAHILQMLLDRLADDALPAMDAFDDAIEALEQEAVEARPRRGTVQRVLDQRARLHRFRRSMLHQREVLLRLARGEFPLIPAAELPFFRDVYDHLVRLADQADDARDLLSGVLEAHLSTVSNRLNEITKVLTLIATVFLPLSFIAGVYGMNFERMPELHWRYGYAYVWALMLATAAALLLWFKRRGWFDRET